MLCEACKRLWDSARTNPLGSWIGEKPELFKYPVPATEWAGAHHITSGALLSAFSIDKCYICSTIFRDFSPELRQQASSFRTFYKLRLKSSREESQPTQDQYELEFVVEILQGKAPIAKKQVFECTGVFKIVPRDAFKMTFVTLPMTDNTLTPKCEKQVRDWLNDCLDAHTSCNREWLPAHRYPTRLIQILDDDNRFRLIESKSSSDRPKYVTLSHCWAIESQLKLTEATRGDLLDGKPISDLPKKFGDAMKIARWMDITHIWIDALCIVQDSQEDWLVQSARMGNIYTHSHCNIAATSSDPTKGLFTSRYREMVEPHAVKDPRSEKVKKTYVIGYDDFWSNSLLDTALHNRGWVLQERLLSPRNIHFGQEQIFWECRCKMACEAYPDGIPHQFRNYKTRAWRQLDRIIKAPTKQPPQQRGYWLTLSETFYKLFRHTNPELQEELQELRPNEAYEIWSRTVERYMECKLTRGADKLVAISGIAQKVAEATGDRYLAGLWDNPKLAQSLLWYVLGRSQADGTRSSRSAPAGSEGYRAPSWSWASVDAQVVWNWPVDCGEILINIVHTDIEEMQHSRMGRVSSATMSIRGTLTEASLHLVSESSNDVAEEDGRYILKFGRSEHHNSHLDNTTTQQYDMEPVIYLDTPLLPGLSSVETYLLPVCLDWRGRSENTATSMAGLLLKKALAPAEQPQYERIGIFGLDQTQAELVYGPAARATNNLGSKFAGTSSTLISLV